MILEFNTSKILDIPKNGFHIKYIKHLFVIIFKVALSLQRKFSREYRNFPYTPTPLPTHPLPQFLLILTSFISVVYLIQLMNKY